MAAASRTEPNVPGSIHSVTLASMPSSTWTDWENDLVVASYFEMLDMDLRGHPYSKAEHSRRLQEQTGRNKGSIGYKIRNVSAILQLSGETWIPGYKPAMNFQRSLVNAVERWLDGNRAWIDRPPLSTRLRDQEVALAFVPPPSLTNEPPPKDHGHVASLVAKFDFAGRDQRNRELGRAGEELVLTTERQVLTNKGRKDLARRVHWISEEEGDGAGFDIASFSPDGSRRLIEVKTTNGWERTPFFISRNELDIAEKKEDVWCLLRVFNFAQRPTAFELRPPLDAHVALSPTSFLASFR